VQFDTDEISHIQKIDGLNKTILEEKVESYFLFPAKHFIASDDAIKRAVKSIEDELEDRLENLNKRGKILEAERLKRRTRYDVAMIREVGYCNGIENYSRHFDGRLPDETPNTLLDYFPHKKIKNEKGEEVLVPDFLTVIDESHVAVPQVGGMYAGDRSRKETLVEHGFRLPSAKDNRPLRFEEFEKKTGQRVYTTATPGKYEIEHSTTVAEQIIRPTGLVDPQIEIKPIVEKGKYKGQVFDFIEQAEKEIKKGGRVLVTTLTKKMAEDLSEYLKEKKIKYKEKTTDLKEELDDLKAKYKRLKRLHKRTRTKNVFNINIENMNNMNNFNKFYIDNVAPPNLEDIVEIEMSDEEIQMLLNYSPEHAIKGILKVKFIKPDNPGESMIVCLDSSRKKYTIRTDNKWMKDMNLEKFRHEFFTYLNSGYVKILDNADMYEFNYYDMMNNKCDALKLVNDKTDRTVLKSVDNLITFDEHYKNNIIKQINEQIDISSDSDDFCFSSDNESIFSSE
jgi:hypothetical protein